MRKIKKEDTVEVISGDDKGMRGTVREIIRVKSPLRKRDRRKGRKPRPDPNRERVIVSGVNIVKKHQRPISTGGRRAAQAGIIQFEAPIHISNVMLVCPSCRQRTRVGFMMLEEGRKVRVCKKCKAIID
jgi:large subunit ribosomal protein L24